MVALSELLLGVALLVFGYYFFFKEEEGKNGKKLPPGPRGLPYVGSLFAIGSRPYLAFSKWAREYGPIVQVQLGRTKAVILSDAKLIKEAFNEPILTGRPDNKAFQLIPGGKLGIISTDGDQWAEQRRFTLRTLRDFGFGRKNMETMIMDEVNDIMTWLKKEAGKSITLNRKFSLAVLNSLWTIMTSERYSHDDPKLQNILKTANESFNESGKTGLPIFFPELAEIFPEMTGWNKMLKALVPLRELFSTAVNDRLKNPGDENDPKDFMDVYLNEVRKTTNPNSSFYKDAGINSLRAVIGDLHGAGSETTSVTLTWAVLYLMKYPDVQQKLREELDQVVGKSRAPSLADKPNLPYTEAVMLETFRLSSIVAMGVFHSALADTTFHGYHIPKGTMIIPNQYWAHFNPDVWGDPENFRPERFLKSDGKTVIKHESLIPFSTGKRVCLGESLARDEFFLFLTSILQRFEIEPDHSKPATLEPKIGFLSAPEPYHCIMKDRFE